MASAIVSMFIPDAVLGAIKLATIIIYVLASIPELGRPARLLAALAAALVVVLPVGPLFMPAIDAAAFLMSLFLVLSLIGEIAARSPDTVRLAHSILKYPIGLIYLPLTAASHLFSVVLNVGGLAIFMSLVAARARQAAEEGQLREQTLAVLRGFSAVPMWAPFSISIALVLSIFRDLHFVDLLPFGLTMAAFHMLSGWALDGRRSDQEIPGGAEIREKGPLVRLLLRILAMAGGAFLCELLLGVRFIEGVLLSALATACLWWVGLRWRGASAMTATPPKAGANGGRNNEVVIIGAAGFIGNVIAASLAPLALGPGTVSPQIVSLLIALVPLAMLGAGYLGLNAIVSGSIIGGLLLPVTVPQDQLFAALALLAGWGIASSSSPLTGSVLLASRLIGRSPLEVAFRWNGLFGLAHALLIGVILLMAHTLTAIR